MTIRTEAAIAYEVGRPMVIEQVELDAPGEGEVLVEVKAAGLCHTDLGVWEGHSPIGATFPLVLGHEGAGIVLETGPGVTDLEPGDHVITFAPECQLCGACHSTKGNFCEAVLSGYGAEPSITAGGRRVFAGYGVGTFANHLVTTSSRLARVRKDAPFDEISYLSCGATTGIGAALIEAKVEAGASVVVFGLGGIGLNIIQGARMAGATTIVGVDINPQKGAMALQLGATHFVDSSTLEGDLVGHLLELTRGGADYTFEAVGNIRLMEQALATARIGWGVCTIVGVAPSGEKLGVLPFDLIMGRKLQGTAMGGVRGKSQLPEIVDWLMEGRFDLKSLITARMPLSAINEGYDGMRRGEGLRSIITF
ncbi:zinc-binding dehydrogenase [Sphingomonas profundi]|uniref:zinc-binding dehydrogenase n=1 Tax=Alterirhizorhabdus profundi TaxID=2681549 RepID=UPI0018D0CEE8|nr:zinc-binding dehydrogenase [Sphingomonas profundi]